jgi:ribosomal protein L40E
MTKKCRNCGYPARDDSSVFCNKCGARLPVQEVLICRKCGNSHSDLKSRFCNKCGAPLQVLSPAISPSPVVRGIPCPGCGFVNVDENSFYCKKCGIAMGKYESDMKTEKDRARDAATRITPSPEHMTAQREPYVPATGQSSPFRERDGIKQKSSSGSYRKVAAAIAGIFLVIVIIGAVVVLGPGILPAGIVNSTVPVSANPSSPGLSITATYAPSPGTTETKIQAAGAPVAGNNPISRSPAISDTSAPWPSEVSNTPAQISPPIGDSTPPWLSENGNTTPPVMNESTNSSHPWPAETSYSTPPWLTGTK